MDSGHGCSTDTGMIENHFPNSRPQSSLNTFRVNNATFRQSKLKKNKKNVIHS